MGMLAIINPSRRKRHGKKRRSAAQRAATRKMLAANRSKHVRTNPVFSFKRRGKKRHHAVHARRRARRNPMPSFRGMGGSAFSLLKTGAIGASGALLVDVGMGFLLKAVPVNATTNISPIAPLNQDGSMNYLYYLAKGGIALGLGTVGRKLPVIGKHAATMAEGAFTVMSYNLIKNLIGTAVPMGAYFNPAPVGRPAAGMGRLAAYMPTTPAGAVPRIRSTGTGAGARAAAVLSAVPANAARR